MPNGKGKSTSRNRDEMLKYSETNMDGHTVLVWLTPKLKAKGQTTMDDIIMYNELKVDILRKLSEIQKWEYAGIIFGSYQSNCSEREKKLNAYIEYIANTIVNLPMPD